MLRPSARFRIVPEFMRGDVPSRTLPSSTRRERLTCPVHSPDGRAEEPRRFRKTPSGPPSHGLKGERARLGGCALRLGIVILRECRVVQAIQVSHAVEPVDFCVPIPDD